MANNKELQTTLSFDEAKLEALTFYMQEKGATVERALQDHIDDLYEKFVPAAARRFLDRNDGPDEKQTKKQDEELKHGRVTGEESTASSAGRREKRQGEKEQKAAQPAAATGVSPREEQKEQTAQQEESQGMRMSM